ncbi:hypothetical protein GLOIN_2v1849317 [Rhizophagus irregularis DAOM 181602=DAOM 197198]|uniref:Uncharacterized protein n=1 Tax=Rhizophagus irregularis (strain DAOM 181602 / DAOM 197198 / MUCL 43194) TaxID=747089 RepID=A0A2P4NK96_RHIID|nr:hypothetical protein GLOIN_2v1849317 [Rhizophagus irregularis DAOM 181602=DAOM 197198]POG53548.1 hypothetical protein GLOIN_2v1849317 [Rhizophagus irregularis DAOM 181602=DAOM 197198]|eukprot:XP_025164155.1 hypothetical protein GLOIN_2v1849317 [Rhizophagus irregularis DAOM 181602=DAOM 197198]
MDFSKPVKIRNIHLLKTAILPFQFNNTSAQSEEHPETETSSQQYDHESSSRVTTEQEENSQVNNKKYKRVKTKSSPQETDNMKQHGVLSVTFNISEGTISVVDSESTLILRSNQYADYFQKKKIKEICPSAINVGKDLHILLAENIYQSVNGEVKEQINKEMSRRKELRFHVEVFKAYTRLQAFCALNLSRSKSETARSQAKSIVVKYFPQISLQNMSLMLQRAPRIYRLLLLSNEDWRLIDSFEELSACFFKSSMNSAANFEIWLNLVRTGQIADYKNGTSMCEEGKKFMKEVKLNIIKEYFDEVDEKNLKDFITDDDDE